jgi:hypothetical protein
MPWLTGETEEAAAPRTTDATRARMFREALELLDR